MKKSNRSPIILSINFLAVLLLLSSIFLGGCSPEARNRLGTTVDQSPARPEVEAGPEPRSFSAPAKNAAMPLQVYPKINQTGASDGFIANSAMGSLLFTRGGLSLAIADSGLAVSSGSAMNLVPMRAIHVQYLGSSPGLKPTGENLQRGVVNQYLGSDPAEWQEGLPVFGGVRYDHLYPDIDLVYTGVDAWKSGFLQVKGTFFVAPGGDPTQIQWKYAGATSVNLQDNGSLGINILGEDPDRPPLTVIDHAPVAWQVLGKDRVDVPVRYVVDSAGVVGFKIGAYDRAFPLVIDPVLEYSTFFGGEGFDEGLDVAVDGSRSPVVIGTTLSVEFPSDLPLQEELVGSRNIFITKFTRDGLGVDFSTFLGGTGDDVAQSVAVDAAGEIYLAGYSLSTDFPATALRAIPEESGGENGFVVKVSLSGGSLRYGALVGGFDDDRILSLDVDSGGNTYLTGYTASDDFPLVDPLQGRYGGGETDAIYMKISAVGNQILFSSYLGGSASEEANGIAIDRDGSPYITGFTTSIDFPTREPLQEELGGMQDAFLTKIEEDFGSYAYSTYLGIGVSSVGNEVVVDRDEHAYLVGTMERTEEEERGGTDVFVLRLGEAGDTLDINIVLGGSGDDEGFDLDLDKDQNIYVVGSTESDDLEAANSFQAGYGGEGDGFLAQLNPAGELVTYNYIGGSNFDVANGITVFGSGDAVIAGVTFSADFPTVNPMQRNYRGEGDVFMMKVGEVEFVPTPAPTNTPEPTPLPPTPTPIPTALESIVESDTFLYAIIGLMGLVLILLIVEVVRNGRRKR